MVPLLLSVALAALAASLAVVRRQRRAGAALAAETDGLRRQLAQLAAENADRAAARERETAEIRLARERLAAFVGTVAEGLVLQDAEARILECNAAAERILGLTREQMAGRSSLDPRWRAIREDGSPFPGPEHPVPVTIRTGRAQRGVTMGVHKPDGSLTWIAINSEPVCDEDGRVRFVACSFADITGRIRIEQDLARTRDRALEASRLKSEFLATMSHEIRTPMNGIVGMSSLLMETAVSEEQREIGDVIHSSAESLLAIINDILDFSKIEAGRMRIEPEEFELRPLVEQTLALLAPRARQKNLELCGDLAADLPAAVHGDAGRFRQVLVNLAGNAIKFTESGLVSVAVRALPAAPAAVRLRVEVRDTGPGIPAEARARIFEPFVQGDGSVTRRYGGTGLGLTISRQLVALMGGTIGCDSEPGRGSLFWFELEMGRPAGRGAAAGTPAGLRVLVVEGDPTAAAATVAELARNGVAAEAAGDGPAALALMRTRTATGLPWHAVLLDWELPGMSGLQFAVEVRADEALAPTPLVILTPTGQAPDPALAAAAGIEAVLAKPVREPQLGRCLKRLAERTAAAGAPPAITAGPTQSPDPIRSLRLLLAEDNPANQRVAKMLLSRMGHTVEVASNGREALERLAGQSYDAVLMDCQMPVLDGFETTRRIRGGREAGVNPRLPVIALTAYAMPGDRRKCLDAGMDDYVSKPVRARDLRAALERCGLAAGAEPAISGLHAAGAERTSSPPLP